MHDFCQKQIDAGQHALPHVGFRVAGFWHKHGSATRTFFVPLSRGFDMHFVCVCAMGLVQCQRSLKGEHWHLGVDVPCSFQAFRTCSQWFALHGNDALTRVPKNPKLKYWESGINRFCSFPKDLTFGARARPVFLGLGIDEEDLLECPARCPSGYCTLKPTKSHTMPATLPLNPTVNPKTQNP